LRDEIARAIAADDDSNTTTTPTKQGLGLLVSAMNNNSNNDASGGHSLTALKEMLQAKFRLSAGEVVWENCLVTDNLFGHAGLRAAAQLNVIRLFPSFPLQIFDVLEKCGWLHSIPGTFFFFFFFFY
jgi:hypothetical protein